MPVPAFGFSVGDFVAVASLVWKLCQTISESSGDAKVFGSLIAELAVFNNIVFQIQQLVDNDSTGSEVFQSTIRKTIQQAKNNIEEFSNYVDTFRAAQPGDEKTPAIANWRKRVRWSFTGMKRIKGFQKAMQSHSAMLSLALQLLNNRAVQGLDQKIGEEVKELGLQMQRHTNDMSLQITSSIRDPWDQEPIKFQDAMGRRYPIPLEVCRTLTVRTGLLVKESMRELKDTPIHDAIEQYAIWLFNPVLGKPKHWNLITAEDWESHARPGMPLGMSLATASIYDESGRRGVFSVKTEAQVAFKTPLPSWAPYPDDAHFQYLPSHEVARSIRMLPYPEIYLASSVTCGCSLTTDNSNANSARIPDFSVSFDRSLDYDIIPFEGSSATHKSNRLTEVGKTFSRACLPSPQKARRPTTDEVLHGQAASSQADLTRNIGERTSSIDQKSGEVIYKCPNDKICRSEFATEDALTDHLRIVAHTPQDLQSLIHTRSDMAPIYGDSDREQTNSAWNRCLRCGMMTSWPSYADLVKEFRRGLKLQAPNLSMSTSLTDLRNGEKYSDTGGAATGEEARTESPKGLSWCAAYYLTGRLSSCPICRRTERRRQEKKAGQDFYQGLLATAQRDMVPA